MLEGRSCWRGGAVGGEELLELLVCRTWLVWNSSDPIFSDISETIMMSPPGASAPRQVTIPLTVWAPHTCGDTAEKL